MKKRYKLKKIRYISPVCPETPHRGICTKFGAAVGTADVITCTNFLVIGQGVFILCGGSKIATSHLHSRSPLTQGWRYRAAREKDRRLSSVCLVS